jgi:hypothetical protein
VSRPSPRAASSRSVACCSTVFRLRSQANPLQPCNRAETLRSNNASRERPTPSFRFAYFLGRSMTGPFFCPCLLLPFKAALVTFGTDCGCRGASSVPTHGDDTDTFLRAGPFRASLVALARISARGPGNRNSGPQPLQAAGCVQTPRPMNTRRRKDISRRSRSHFSGSCWYGRLVRSLGRCAHSSSRDQRRNPN